MYQAIAGLSTELVVKHSTKSMAQCWACPSSGFWNFLETGTIMLNTVPPVTVVKVQSDLNLKLIWTQTFCYVFVKNMIIINILISMSDMFQVLFSN